ncbi:MAG: sulfatase activating formylglycine-generating enzyme, partial [Myxococcota bacterium]
VRDPVLGRNVAMKIMREQAPRHRFLAEAQLSGMVAHPGVVPVHELGTLPDGRPYFTMREVRGDTLGDRIVVVHTASRETGGWTHVDGWSLRRLVEVVLRAAEALAAAHAKGIVHRDVKPANLLVGAFGEVVVVDWGVARAPGTIDDPSGGAPSPDPRRTAAGAMIGTPAYMAPEQARGDQHTVGPHSDVYALGAVLFEVLTGRPPYSGGTFEILTRVLLPHASGPEWGTATPPGLVPEDLRQLVDRATAHAPSDRPPDAGAFATELRAWLDGQRDRDRALAGMRRALARDPETLRAKAAEVRDAARAALDTIPTWQPEGLKLPHWEALAEAAALEAKADLEALRREQDLRASIALVPDLSEAHAALSAKYLRDHAVAERDDDPRTALRTAELLRTHAQQLPQDHPDRRSHLAYLEGTAAVTLLTEVPCEVRLHRIVLHRRRYEPVFERSLGTTPLRAVPVPHGRWLLTLHAPGRPEVRYPMYLERGAHWSGIRPGSADPFVVPIPAALADDDVYIPPGWFLAGTVDREVVLPMRLQWLWAEPYIIGRHPVTMDTYAAWLNRLRAGGQAEAADRHQPTDQGGVPMLPRGPDGGFRTGVDPDGDLIEPRHPALAVDWYSAWAFAQALAADTGLPWRLPGELEWEKAARGVDGRDYPMGPYLDASWSNTRDAWEHRSTPSTVEMFPLDCSVYGVRGMAGNVRDWTGDLWNALGPPLQDGRVLPPAPPDGRLADDTIVVGRGGAWPTHERSGRCFVRVEDRAYYRHPGVGFRVCRSLP